MVNRLLTCVLCLTFVTILSQGIAMALPMGETVEAIADRLDQDQVKGGVNIGAWPFEADFTGSITVGMAAAYERTCDPDYKTSAELGGVYILGNPVAGYGDDIFAMKMLSQINDNPEDNPYRTALDIYYHNVEDWEDLSGCDCNGTLGYLEYFYEGTEPSTAVFYLAMHVVASNYVDANDKEIWRNQFLGFLARVDDDTAAFPVMALGAATWALAETGDLNDTPVDPNGDGQPYWDGVTLADLPELLKDYQVDSGPYAGSFYWQFNPDPCELNSGFTEDTIYPILGLSAAQRNNPSMNYETELSAAKQVLANGIDPDGTVYGHLWLVSPDFYLYAGEMLSGLGELVINGDLDLDDEVDLEDFSIFGLQWERTDCGPGNCWCSGADIDKSGAVGFTDFTLGVGGNWLIHAE